MTWKNAEEADVFRSFKDQQKENTTPQGDKSNQENSSKEGDKER